MKELWVLFTAFFKAGVLTFGGGYAMLPILQRECVDKNRWITEEEMLDYYAISQCLPGMIAINTAIFVGRHKFGRRGGLIAALGVTLPSLLIIMAIAAFLKNFLEYEMVQRAFYGIRIAVAALIVSAIIKMWKKSVKDWFCAALYVIAFALSLLLDVNTVYLIVLAVVAGIAMTALRGGLKR